jgi:hypothetical protein
LFLGDELRVGGMGVMKKTGLRAATVGMFVVVLLVSPLALAAPIYQTVLPGRTGYQTGSVEVWSASQGTNYGKAKIEWFTWYDTPSGYYYYAYKIYNNEAGLANDRSDDYHFGHVYDSGTYLPINEFALSWGSAPQMPTSAVTILGSAASSSGGNPWGGHVDVIVIPAPIATGIDWSTTQGAGAQTIAPAQWDKQGSKWYLIYAGDTSTGDTGAYTYFEIASTYAPGNITASVSNSLYWASGTVMGPAIVPEPASCIVLGLGFAGLLRRRRLPQ